jgi:hypothetical protein
MTTFASCRLFPHLAGVAVERMERVADRVLITARPPGSWPAAAVWNIGGAGPQPPLAAGGRPADRRDTGRDRVMGAAVREHPDCPKRTFAAQIPPRSPHGCASIPACIRGEA